MKTFLYIITVLLFLLTMVGFFPNYAYFMFAGGSDDLMELRSGNIWLQISLVILFLLVVILFKNRLSSKIFITLLLILIIWLFSGRTISIFPDGRISEGWFYFETSRENICNTQVDCDKIFYYETVVEEKPFWRIRIRNKQTSTDFFVVPINWGKTLKMFRNKFPHSQL